MRRLQRLGQFFRARASRGWIRCVLTLEELSPRDLLTPFVYFPGETGTVETSENVPYTYPYYAAFQAIDPVNGGQTYAAQLAATNGTLSVDATVAAAAGVAVSGSDTAAVTLTGTLDGIDSVFANGLTFNPTAYFSGEANVSVTVTDTTNGNSGSNSGLVYVYPVVSDAVLGVSSPFEQYAPSSGFVFPPGLISVTNWPDADGSEEVTLGLSLDAPDPAAFTLSANGAVLQPVEDGFWFIKATSESEMRSILDSLVLTPPPDFNGRATLSVRGDMIDSAAFPSLDKTVTDPSDFFRFLGQFDVGVRFFQGGSVATPPLSSREGGTIDLGGRYSVSDPDELDGDVHTLTLSVPGGTLRLDDAALPPNVSAGRSVAADGSTTITLGGTVAALNDFLSRPGCLTYTAEGLTFSGLVPLSVTLTNQPALLVGGSDTPSLQAAEVVTGSEGSVAPPTDRANAPNAFTGTAFLEFSPVADHVAPTAADATTEQDTPVALSINLTPLADTDGSESVLVVLGGVPDGATLSAGTDLGGGKWALTPDELAGLTFTPPPGATGSYAITVTAIVTDAAPGVGTDSATESTTFTVTVTPKVVTVTPTPTGPAPAPAPAPAPLLPPAVGTVAAFAPVETTPTASGDVGDEGNRNDGADRHDADQGPARVPFAGYTGGPAPTPPTLAEQTGRGGPQGAASAPFPQGEAPAPLYAGGERHPLPPVLPLDQTLPVAGFSDSGGDSFTLVDMIYRGAAPQPAAFVTPASHATAVRAEGEAPAAEAKEPVAAVAAVPPADDPGRGSPPAAPAEAAGEDSWRAWAVGGAVAAATLAAAGMRLSGGPNWFAARITRRLLRALHRRPTERTA